VCRIDVKPACLPAGWQAVKRGTLEIELKYALQVVVRNGEMLEAVPPDYRELDYVPPEFRYVLPRAPTAKTLSLPRQDSGALCGTLSDPLNKTASGPFSSFSQEAFKKVGKTQFWLGKILAGKESSCPFLSLPRQDSGALCGTLSDPLNKTASGPFSSFSQEAFKKVRKTLTLNSDPAPFLA